LCRPLRVDMSLYDQFFQPLIKGQKYVLQVQPFITGFQSYVTNAAQPSSFPALKTYLRSQLKKYMVRVSQRIIDEDENPDYILDISCEIIDTGPCVGLLTNHGYYHLLSNGSFISENLIQQAIREDPKFYDFDEDVVDSIPCINLETEEAYQELLHDTTIIDSVEEECLQLPVYSTPPCELAEPMQHCCQTGEVTEVPTIYVPNDPYVCTTSYDYDTPIFVSEVTQNECAITCSHTIEHIDKGIHRRKKRSTLCDTEHTSQCDDNVTLRKNMRQQHDAHVLQTTVWKNRYKHYDLSQTQAEEFLKRHRDKEYTVAYYALADTAQMRNLTYKSCAKHGATQPRDHPP